MTEEYKPSNPVAADISDAAQVTSALQKIYRPECRMCELVESYRSQGLCTLAPPSKPFCGLMLVGEGPGQTEIRTRVPFTGQSGKLLENLLGIAGLNREECVITNATLCKPPRKENRKSLHDQYPKAIWSCLPRLEEEIKKWRPRVIIALGQAALIALTGYEETRAVRLPNPCTCSEDRKIGPVISCPSKACDWRHTGLVHPDQQQLWAEEFVRNTPVCPKCGQPLKPKARMIPCPVCGGRKTRVEKRLCLKTDHGLTWVAGGIFRAEALPSRLDEFGVKYVMATYHPSYILRKAATKGDKQIGGQFVAFAAGAHFKRAVSLLKRDARWDCITKVTRDPDQIREYTSDPEAVYAVDIETDNKNPYDVTEITCVGIASNRRPETLVVDTHWLSGGIGDLQKLFVLPPLREFLEDPDRQKVFQNRVYDELTLELVWRVIVQGTVGDTMLAHHALYPDEQHDLHKIVFRYTDAPPWKPPKKQGGKLKFASDQELFEYNARDTRGTIEAWPHLVAEMEEAEVSQVHALDLEMTTIALEMRRSGLPIDQRRLEEIGLQCEQRAASALKRMRDVAGATFNPNSHKQLAEVLYNADGPIKLTVTDRTATGAPSTAAETLARLTQEPFVRDLIEYRENANVVRNYMHGKGMVIRNGRIHPEWKPTGARTGRWSSSPNFQNWPAWLRAMVAVAEGRRLVGADASQLEMRVLAGLSGDVDLMRRCRDADESDKLNPEKDPHSYVGAMAFGAAFTSLDSRDPDHDKTDLKCSCQRCRKKLLRDNVKRVVYGLNYGAGAQRILNVIYDSGYTGPVITLNLVHTIIETYFHAFPGVPAWRTAMVDQVEKSREVRSPIFKRRRVFPLGEVDTTVCYNFPIQAGAADIINMQLLRLHNELGVVDPSAVILAQVHDAFYVECSEDRAEDVAKLVTDCLTCEYLGMPFTASAKIGVTWRDVS